MASESLRARRSARTIDEATEKLTIEPGERPADLVDLVQAVRGQSVRVVAIPAEVILHWRNEEPRSWQIVLEWLTRMDVEIHVN